MSRTKHLTKRQLAVIEDLFRGELDEQAVLDKHNISRNLFNKWQSDDNFIARFNECIAAAYRQSAALIASYSPLAAAKLIALTESDKAETARKACLDILSMPTPDSRNKLVQSTVEGTQDSTQNLTLKTQNFSPQTAGKLLAVLAKEKSD